MSDDERFVSSSGNIYEALGFDDPEGEQAKADLAIEIIKVVRERDLTQQQTAEILGIRQPKVSRIVRGHLNGISQDALIGYLRSLGQNIEVTVKPGEPARDGEAPHRGSLVVRGHAYGE